MPANSPHAFVYLLGALLLAAYASPPVAAGDSKMVVVHAARAAGATAAWQRRLEDDVAPEFPSAAIGGPPGRGITYTTFNPDKPSCINGCAAKGPGDSYTQKRACTYQQRCNQGGRN